MRILFIGKRFYTNRDAFQERYGRIHQLPLHWSQAGIPTNLWLIDYHTRVSAHRNDGTLEIRSTPAFSLKFPWQWLNHAIARNTRPFDTVVASGDCYIGHAAYLLARRLRARFIFDVYDKYDEFPGYLAPPGIDLFTRLLDKADVRLFASKALMNDLKRSPDDCLVPNGIDEERFKCHDMHASRKALGLPQNRILVGYFGSITEDRGVADLIEAGRILRTSGQPIEVILAGKKQHDLDTSMEGVTYLGNLPAEQVPMAMSCCNILALPYRRSTYLDAASSCKIAEYLAMRKPIAATLTPNLASNFPLQTQQLRNLLATPGDPASIAHAIARQLQSGTLANTPSGMTWREISAATLEKMMHPSQQAPT